MFPSRQLWPPYSMLLSQGNPWSSGFLMDPPTCPLPTYKIKILSHPYFPSPGANPTLIQAKLSPVLVRHRLCCRPSPGPQLTHLSHRAL